MGDPTALAFFDFLSPCNNTFSLVTSCSLLNANKPLCEQSHQLSTQGIYEVFGKTSYT